MSQDRLRAQCFVIFVNFLPFLLDSHDNYCHWPGYFYNHWLFRLLPDEDLNTPRPLSVHTQTPLLWSPLQTGPLCGNAADPDVLADRRDRMAHSPRRGNIQRVDAIFDTLGDQEVQLILALTFDALKARGLPLPSSLPSSAVKNDIYNNTGFKKIACMCGSSTEIWQVPWQPDSYAEFNSHKMTKWSVGASHLFSPQRQNSRFNT